MNTCSTMLLAMSDFQRLAWTAYVPFLVLAVLMGLERLALARGMVGVHRMGIPFGSWSEPLGIVFPLSLAPQRFPVRDDLGRGAAHHDARICVQWLNAQAFAFWDRRARGGVNVASMLVSGLVTLESGRDDEGTVAHVERRVRVLPLLTLIATFVSVGILERAWGLPPEIKWYAVAFFGVFTAIHTAVSLGQMRDMAAILTVALIERAQSGESWVSPEELARAGAGDPFGL